MQIRSKLILAFLILSLVPLLLTNIITYSNNQKSLTKGIIQHLESVASIQQNRVDGIVLQNLERLKLVASRTQLRISLKKFIENNDPVHQKKMNRILHDANNSIGDFNQLNIANLAGVIVASTDKNKINAVNFDQEWFISGKKKSTIDMFFLDDANVLKVYFSAPLFLNDTLLGVLMIESSVENLLSSISDYTGLGNTGETILAEYENDGTAVFLTPTRFNPDAALRLTVPLDKIIPINKALTEKQLILTNAIDYRGKPVLAVTRYVNRTDWGIVVKIDKAEAFIPLLKMRNLLIISVIVSVLAVIFLALYLAGEITLPISKLTEVAKKISQGNHEEQANETSEDETGVLAKTFNKMTATLIKTKNDLEKNIEELHDSESRFRLLMDSIEALVYVADMQTYEILFINKYGKKIMGDITGKTCWQNMQKGQTGPCAFCTNKYLLDQDGKPLEVYTWEFKNTLTGQWFYIKDRAIKWSDGRIARLEIATDITASKKFEQEKQDIEKRLHQAQKMEAIGTLAGGIAHDFNNILSAIIGYTDMALTDLPTGHKAINDLQRVIKAGNRAADLVNQILTFSRQSDQELKPLRIQLVIKEALKLLRSTIPTTIEIKQNIDPDCDVVLADPTQIHQVIMNLCTNAYHAMRESGGILEVSLQPVKLTTEDLNNKINLHPGSYVKLTVSDNGCGITKNNQKKIFEPYFTTKPKDEGTGLGLALVHGIILSLGGDITVYSEPGEGTIFHIYLPMISATKEIIQDQDTAPLPMGNERIILVDDDEELAQMNKRMLENLGYKVTAMTSSADTLDAFQKEPDSYDLLLTDMTMPHMTGAELSEKILAIRPDIPIIICTGFSELINEEKAKNIGINSFVMKPVIKNDLAKAVRKELDAAVETPAFN